MQSTPDPVAVEDGCFVTLTQGQRLGMSFVVAASTVSFVTVTGLLTYFANNVFREMRHKPKSEWRLVHTDVDAYFLSLLIGDACQALGGILNVRWINQHTLRCGDYCSFQGVMIQLGTPLVALSTMAISLHTFFVIFFKWVPPRNRHLRIGVIAFIWTLMFVVVFCPWAVHRNDGHHYYAPTPYWCWISQRYLAERIAGEYSWLWFAAFISLIAYVLLFLRLRGNIVVDPERWQNVTFRWYPYPSEEPYRDRRSDASSLAQKEARKMLWYPLCYIVVILPQSAVRWRQFTGHPVPFIALAVCATIFRLSGFMNVLLFMLTRPKLMIFRRNPPDILSQTGSAHARSQSHPSPHLPHGLPRVTEDGIFEFDTGSPRTALPGSAADMMFGMRKGKDSPPAGVESPQFHLPPEYHWPSNPSPRDDPSRQRTAPRRLSQQPLIVTTHNYDGTFLNYPASSDCGGVQSVHSLNDGDHKRDTDPDYYQTPPASPIDPPSISSISSNPPHPQKPPNVIVSGDTSPSPAPPTHGTLSPDLEHGAVRLSEPVADRHPTPASYIEMK
ncbi:hypothetical protein BD410DRAFT_902282 [Rickenella mellea]|uniref:Uncharacterized protein n=1 Tax=Rickenella mellea TaxID=50990 RepID=A0A4Y7PLS0_9AGAM|nr:hypothetical protein BD410DRAFT_902282 [Rickenella mellea]